MRQIIPTATSFVDEILQRYYHSNESDCAAANCGNILNSSVEIWRFRVGHELLPISRKYKVTKQMETRAPYQVPDAIFLHIKL